MELGSGSTIPPEFFATFKFYIYHCVAAFTLYYLKPLVMVKQINQYFNAQLSFIDFLMSLIKHGTKRNLAFFVYPSENSCQFLYCMGTQIQILKGQ